MRQQHPKLFSLKERNFFFSSLRILVSKASIQQHLKKSKLNKIKKKNKFKLQIFFLF
jgi:hypothetical protein